MNPRFQDEPKYYSETLSQKHFKNDLLHTDTKLMVNKGDEYSILEVIN